MDIHQLQNIIQYARHTPDLTSTIHGIMKALQRYSGFECVAIRIKNTEGDFPYYTYRGFTDDFIKVENTLCSFDDKGNILRDCSGCPVLECMCGNVLQGRFDPALPFFTEKGSFWTNSTTELLASTTEGERQCRTRNRCNREGYESVGLFPMKYISFTVGLLQLNDRRENMFSEESIENYELIAKELAETVYETITFKQDEI